MFLQGIPIDTIIHRQTDITQIWNNYKILWKKNYYLNSSWLLWGGVGSDAGTSTVFGPWAMALASKSSWGRNGKWNGLGPRLLVTGKANTTMNTFSENCSVGRTSQPSPSAGKGTLLKGSQRGPSVPSGLTNTPAFPASSSAVAKPFAIFWQATGGGVGGREAGGVGGLLKLFCCRRPKDFKLHATEQISHDLVKYSSVNS